MRDWDLMPAPKPWYSLEKLNHGFAWVLDAVFLGFGGLFAALSLRANNPPILILALPLLIMALVFHIVTFFLTTDGIEHWEIHLGRNFDLCRAMETAMDEMLKVKKYRYSNGPVYSACKDKITSRPLGRNYIIVPSPGIMQFTGKNNRFEPDRSYVIIEFAVRPGSKYVSPYLSIQLRNVRQSNYDFVIGLQNDVMYVLEKLNYTSFGGPADQNRGDIKG